MTFLLQKQMNGKEFLIMKKKTGRKQDADDKQRSQDVHLLHYVTLCNCSTINTLHL